MLHKLWRKKHKHEMKLTNSGFYERRFLGGLPQAITIATYKCTCGKVTQKEFRGWIPNESL